MFKLIPSDWAIISFIYEQKICESISIETGVQDKFFAKSVIGYTKDTFSLGAASNYLTIPIRIILNQKIFYNVSLIQRFGYSYSIAHSWSGSDTRFFTNDNYSYKINKDFPSTYSTFVLGLGLEWLFSKSWKLTFFYDINIPFNKLIDYDIIGINNSDYAHFESSGLYQTAMLGIGYRISNLWIKE